MLDLVGSGSGYMMVIDKSVQFLTVHHDYSVECLGP